MVRREVRNPEIRADHPPARTSAALLQSGGDEFHFSLSRRNRKTTADDNGRHRRRRADFGLSPHIGSINRLKAKQGAALYDTGSTSGNFSAATDETLLLELREPGTISKGADIVGSVSLPEFKDLDAAVDR